MRAKLIVSHLLVMLIAMTLFMLLSGAYLRRYESAVEQERLRDIASPLAVAALSVERSSVTSNRPVDRLAELDQLGERLEVRVLVFSPDGMVVYDTASQENLRGEALVVSDSAFEDLRERPDTRTGRAGIPMLTIDGEGALSGSEILLTSPSRQSDGYVIGITANNQRFPWIARLTPRLLIVAVISMIGASIAVYILSNRIARPIAGLTSASDAMAAGKLAQRVPGEDPGEIGRLVASFNAMSSRVADTDQSQRRLLADVAHELRTPLTSVQGYAQALQDGVITVDDDRSKALAVIRGESERMNRLIVQLLDLSRLESGQAQMKSETIDLTQLFERVRMRFEREAGSKAVRLECQVEPGLQITGDQERLDQLLGNLLSNALRHTPAGGEVTISSGSRLDADQRRSVVLRVRDSGEGIVPQMMPYLFERFRRGPAGGFGLGLSIVREIVDLHHGSIAVESQQGIGTTMEIVLPVHPVD